MPTQLKDILLVSIVLVIGYYLGVLANEKLLKKIKLELEILKTELKKQ